MCASNRGRLIALGIVLLLLPASLLAQQGYVNTSSVSGAPGSAVNIPLTAVLNTNVSIDSLAFGLSVTPTGTAPAISQQLAFTPASSSISVSLTAYAPGQIGPLLTMSPAISGTVTLGQVQVSIPPNAVNGQTYTIAFTEMVLPASNGNNSVSVYAGPNTTLTVTTPAISLGQTSLTFSAQQGGTNPANQTVSISNGGGGTLNWSASVASGSWLSVSPPLGTGAGTLTISANITGLSATTYTGAIQVSATGAVTQTINVSLTVSSIITPPSPVLSVSTSALTFTAQQGAANLASQTATVSNLGGGTLNWTAAVTSGAWLSVSPASANSPGPLTISTNIAGLTANTYTGAIQVAASGATGSPQTINVTLTITPPPTAPALAVSPVTLAFTAQQASANPSSQTVAISNSGTGTLNWTASVTSGSWLSVSSSSGTAPANLTISANIAGLAVNTYTGTILVAASGAGSSPQTINVTLTITAVPVSPVIALSPTSLAFSGQQGAANPQSQTVALSNSGSGTLNWSATVTSGTWLTVSPASGTGAALLTIAANSAGLSGGTYNGTIQVAASGAGNSPQTLTVTFTVVQAAVSAISLAPNALQFVVIAGSNPATQTFQVLNNFSGALGWTASANTLVGSNWLSISPAAGVSPGTITVTVNSASLAKGIYLGNITITALPSANAINSPQSLLVALAVSAPMIGQNGIVDGAGFASAISSGGISSLFGTNLAASTASAAAVPLPTTLAGTQVLVNGVAAPLFYVSPTQINFQMPAESVGASVSVVVVSAGINSLNATVNIAAAGPGIFTATSNGQGQGAILNQDYSANSAQNPAAAGSVIQIFATGLGLTNPSMAAGQPASSSPLANTVSTPVVTINGVAASVGFSGLAPGFVGLYQVNVTVPPGTPSGAATLQIQINGQSSNTATVAIK
jgi:uncharacterized protein (TIGR03437 family)